MKEKNHKKVIYEVENKDDFTNLEKSKEKIKEENHNDLNEKELLKESEKSDINQEEDQFSDFNEGLNLKNRKEKSKQKSDGNICNLNFEDGKNKEKLSNNINQNEKNCEKISKQEILNTNEKEKSDLTDEDDDCFEEINYDFKPKKKRKEKSKQKINTNFKNLKLNEENLINDPNYNNNDERENFHLNDLNNSKEKFDIFRSFQNKDNENNFRRDIPIEMGNFEKFSNNRKEKAKKKNSLYPTIMNEQLKETNIIEDASNILKSINMKETNNFNNNLPKNNVLQSQILINNNPKLETRILPNYYVLNNKNKYNNILFKGKYT